MYTFEKAFWNNIIGRYSWMPIKINIIRGSRTVAIKTFSGKNLQSAMKFAEEYKIMGERVPVRVRKDGKIVGQNSVDLNKWIESKKING